MSVQQPRILFILADDRDYAHVVLRPPRRISTASPRMAGAPTVKEITGEGDHGPFGIIVRGVRGAYFISALEFDDEEPFPTSMRQWAG